MGETSRDRTTEGNFYSCSVEGTRARTRARNWKILVARG